MMGFGVKPPSRGDLCPGTVTLLQNFAQGRSINEKIGLVRGCKQKLCLMRDPKATSDAEAFTSYIFHTNLALNIIIEHTHHLKIVIMGVCKKSASHKTSKSFHPSPPSTYEQRVQSALLAWKQADGALSITKTASLYAVSKTTLYSRIHGRQPRFTPDQIKQLLRFEEENALKNWLLQLYAWG